MLTQSVFFQQKCCLHGVPRVLYPLSNSLVSGGLRRQLHKKLQGLTDEQNGEGCLSPGLNEHICEHLDEANTLLQVFVAECWIAS